MYENNSVPTTVTPAARIAEPFSVAVRSPSADTKTQAKVAGAMPKNSPSTMNSTGPARIQAQANHSGLSGRMRSLSLNGVAAAAPRINTPTKVSVIPRHQGEHARAHMGQGAEGIVLPGIEGDRCADQRHQSAGVEVPLFHKRAEQTYPPTAVS